MYCCPHDRQLMTCEKAKVESGVQVVERWILARLRHWQFFSIAELDAAVAQLLPALNERAFKKLPGSRCDAFARLDAPYLRPLPATRFVLADWKRASVTVREANSERGMTGVDMA